jgi:hypothetical protein
MHARTRLKRPLAALATERQPCRRNGRLVDDSRGWLFACGHDLKLPVKQGVKFLTEKPNVLTDGIDTGNCSEHVNPRIEMRQHLLSLAFQFVDLQFDSSWFRHEMSRLQMLLGF